MSEQIQNDPELWQRVRQDDRAAFEALYRRYINLVYVEVHRRIGNKTDAEDITQEIFLCLWEKRMTIKLEGKIFSYLYGMVQHQVLNYFRTKKISAKYLAIWEEIPEHSAVQQVHTYTSTQWWRAEHAAEAEREKLPQKMRQVYELRYEQRMNSEEIAAQLIISPNTVRNHLKAVRKRFTTVVRKSLQSLLFW